MRKTRSYMESREVYRERFPASRMTFQMTDFHLYRLLLEGGRFVAGFGSIHTLTPGILDRLAD